VSEGDEPPRSRVAGATASSAFGIVVSIVSLAGVGWWASRQSAPHLPSDDRGLAYVAIALCAYAAITAARGLRWHSIVHGARIEASYRQTLELVIIGYMGNTVLPLRGGEVLRVLLLARESAIGYPRAIGTIVPERLFDVVALTTVFASLTVIGVAGSPVGPAPAAIGAGGIVLGAIGLLVYARMRRRGRLATFAERVGPLTAASRGVLNRRGAGLFALSVGIWLSEALVLFLVAHSLDLHIGLLESLYVVIAASLVSLIPAGPGFAGTFDTAALFALKALDIEGSAALSCLVLYRLVIFGPITAAGMVLLIRRHGGLRMLRGARAPASEPA
jgi:hypothetical protein